MQTYILLGTIVLLLCLSFSSGSGATGIGPIQDGESVMHLREGFVSPSAPYRALPMCSYDYSRPAEFAAKLKSEDWGGAQLAYAGWGPDYLQGEDGWRSFIESLKACGKNGLEVWIYDEAGYPSGKARNLTIKDHPEYEPVGLFYDSTDISLKEAKEIEWTLPKGKPFFIALCPIEWTGETNADRLVDLTDKASDGVLKLQVEKGTWRVMAFVEDRLYEGTHAPLTGGPYVNIMNPDAVHRFIEVTHEAYYSRCPEEFGKTIKAFFTDEPSLMGGYLAGDVFPHPVLSWWGGLPDAFAKRNGYDVRQALPALFNDAGSDTARKRSDYYSTIADLTAENYFGQIENWCAAHNVRFTGHLLWEESLLYHVNFYGSMFPSLARMDWPGIDVLGCNYGRTAGARTEGGPVTPKLISSAAHLYNKERTASESFCFVNDKTPIQDLQAHLAWQWVLGINTLTTLSIQKVDPADVLKQVNEYAGRLSYMLTRGRFSTDVAVLYPIASIWSDFIPTRHHVSNFADNPKARDVDDAWHEVSDELLACQRDFDYIDEASIEKANVSSGTITIRENRYSTLVLPHVTTLRTSTLKQIARFVENGGTLISYATIPVNREDAGSVDEFKSLVDNLWDALAKYKGKVIHTGTIRNLGEALDKAGEPDVQITPRTRDIYYQHRVLPEGDIYFLVNNSTNTVSGDVKFRAIGDAQVWDPATGETKNVTAKRQGRFTSLNLELPGRNGVFVVFQKKAGK